MENKSNYIETEILYLKKFINKVLNWFIDIILYLKRNTLLFLILFFAVVGYEIFNFYYTKNDYYETHIIVSSSVVPNYLIVDILNNYNSIVETGNNDQLVQTLNISLEVAKQIQSIQASEMYKSFNSDMLKAYNNYSLNKYNSQILKMFDGEMLRSINTNDFDIFKSDTLATPMINLNRVSIVIKSANNEITDRIKTGILNNLNTNSFINKSATLIKMKNQQLLAFITDLYNSNFDTLSQIRSIYY
ncbi:MAG: hypothetical protein HY738_09960 [Bacteroidia bacterium]|nr:hypothetical protein [Bacteroidia bacterium]